METDGNIGSGRDLALSLARVVPPHGREGVLKRSGLIGDPV
jgi:hypothetical protein